MKTTRKFELLADRFEHKAGTICYECQKHDYGLVRDDENQTGEWHVFMTLDPEGDYPGFTVLQANVRRVE